MSHSSEHNQFQVRPNSIPWPPIVILTAVGIGWLLNRHLPSLMGLSMVGHFPFAPVQIWLGWLLVGLALAMDVWVLMIFRNHKTNIRPDRPAESLVSSGPFAYSRNPIYVGNVAIILGLSMARGSVWYLLCVIPVFLLIQNLAIKREEIHLAARFGDAWVSYSKSVRRWL